ncbi:hypothetical protein ES703_20686 [subsurface metagenome]
MALEDRIDHILNLIEAAAQRQDSLRDLATRLRTGALWRTPDGALQLDATLEQKRQIGEMIERYCADLESITAAIRLALQEPGPG